VVLRSEGPKRARHGVPPVQHVQILFVSHPFLGVVLRHALCLREGVSWIIGSWRPARVHFRPESTKLRRKIRTGFGFEKFQFCFVFVRVEWMAGWKVGGVQERRSHLGHVGVQVRRFDPENETVGEAESKIVAVTRQQLFVICTVHDEFAEFEYGEADCEWTIHHYAWTRRLHENQVGIHDRAALEGGFARGRDEFLRIAHESRIDALSQILARLSEKNCSAAVCTMQTQIRFRRSDAARCSISQTVA